MTRRMVLRSVAWRGEGAGPWPFVGVLPAGFDPRYRVTGLLSADFETPPDLEAVTITYVDPETGETGGTVTVRGDTATLTAAADADPMFVKRLWTASRRLVGLARRATRPPGLTDITDDEQKRRVVREVRAKGRRPTQRNVAAMSGTFTVYALRGYLRVNGRKWSEIIDT